MENEVIDHIVKPRVVRFNEREYWCDEIQTVTKAIWVHYLYDSASANWCCSTQLHYWLEAYNVDIEFIDGLSEEEIEYWYEEIWRGTFGDNNPDVYYLCRDIDKCKTYNIENYKCYGEETTFEQIKDKLQGNPFYFYEGEQSK